MIATEVKVKPAGLMTIAAPLSIASWIQSMSSCSAFDWRNSTGHFPAALRQIARPAARVVLP
jgi:hypothetical protein